jgi:hypothetical protein
LVILFVYPKDQTRIGPKAFRPLMAFRQQHKSDKSLSTIYNMNTRHSMKKQLY